MDRLSIAAGDGGRESFRAVWNGARFREARRLYKRRAGASDQARSRICHDCPSTVLWEEWQTHLATGGATDAFRSRFSFNDGFNYFWQRRPTRPTASPRGPAATRDAVRGEGSDPLDDVVRLPHD